MQTGFNGEVAGAWDPGATEHPPIWDTDFDAADRSATPGQSVWRGDVVKAARAEIRRRHLSLLQGEWFE